MRLVIKNLLFDFLLLLDKLESKLCDSSLPSLFIGVFMSQVSHQGCQPYPILGYSTLFEQFVPQKKLYRWGTIFVPHLDCFLFA